MHEKNMMVFGLNCVSSKNVYVEVITASTLGCVFKEVIKSDRWAGP